MHRIEIIHLRVNGAGSTKEAVELLKQALKTNSNEIAHLVKIYHHLSVEGDLCVILNWESGEIARSWCDLGLHLTSALKEFGRVDHSVWVES